MKKSIFSTSLLCVIILATACEEMPPEIRLEPPENISKKVLIEEFTGVNCVNCPQGSAELESIRNFFGPANVKVVSIHSGFFAEPHPVKSVKDLRTSEGEDILQFLGAPFGYPSAVVGRTELDGDLQQGRNNWQGSVNSLLQEEAQVAMSMTADLDKSTRELRVSFAGSFSDDIDYGVRYSVMLNESGIIEGQEVPEIGWVEDYSHKHVLRTMLTNATGNNLAPQGVSGESFQRNLDVFTIPADWVIENMEVIVFLHGDANNKKILQVESVELD